MPDNDPDKQAFANQQRAWANWYDQKRHGLDHTGRIDRDLPCAACGYNLRSLTPRARCPECGIAVAAALHNSPLLALDRAWIIRLAPAIAWLYAGAFICLLLCALDVADARGRRFVLAIPIEPARFALLAPFASFALCYGLLRVLCLPTAYTPPDWWPRWTRLALIPAALLLLLHLFRALSQLTPTIPLNLPGLHTLLTFTAAAIIACHIAALFHAKRDRRIADAAHACAIALTASVTIFPLLDYAGFLNPTGVLSGLISPVTFLLNLIAAATLIFAPIGFLALLHTFHHHALTTRRALRDYDPQDVTANPQKNNRRPE